MKKRKATLLCEVAFFIHQFMKVLVGLVRFFTHRRYEVKFIGASLLNEDVPMLIFPNHQALVDPQLLYPELYRYGTVVPVVTADFFKNRISRAVLNKLEAIPVGEFNARDKNHERLKQITSTVYSKLSEGKNVLLYPAGQITKDGVEVIKNKRGAWVAVQEMPPETKVIGVRINGLWGSMWSKAKTGRSPHFGLTLLKAVGILVVNAVFLTPKREVVIEFEDITLWAIEKSKQGKRLFNGALEEFYNTKEEQLVRVPKFFWKRKEWSTEK